MTSYGCECDEGCGLRVHLADHQYESAAMIGYLRVAGCFWDGGGREMVWLGEDHGAWRFDAEQFPEDAEWNGAP